MAGRPSNRPPDFRKADSGIAENGRWTPAFEGQRAPFGPGNDAHLKHGAYASSLRLSPRADELAAELRPFLPASSPAFETTLHSYALILTRVEKAAAAIERLEADPAQWESAERLLKDFRLWLLAALRYASELGLSPAAQARLWRDAGVGKAASAQAALREHLEAAYGNEAA